MEYAGVFAKSGKGSNNWILEKFAKIIFIPSTLYVFFFFLLSYKVNGSIFYVNLFFIDLINISILFMLMLSGFLLSYLRFGAVLEDYIKSPHTRIIIKILFIAFNIFFFTFTFITFIYFNFIISITTL
jgi:succinate dehydrogenase hydrophobic anchor subunit